MQTDSAAGLPASDGGNTPAPSYFSWRDVLTSLVLLPAVILATAFSLFYVQWQIAPQNAEISTSEYRFVLQLARTHPALTPKIAMAVKGGKIHQKEFDAILDGLKIAPSAPTVSQPRPTLKQI
jgi:hypothetical protein